MCGIFGFSGKVGKKANLKKLKALGLYNVQRGTDSCGYYYNGHIVKGVDGNANFSKFIAENELIPGDLKTEVFMGHTRKSTSGQNTAANAHPHVIDKYIQTHNGIIKNIWALCTKYGVDHSKITVDSIGLATLIQKFGFDILNKYEGYAALSMTFVDDPTSLYLYHGASKETANGTLFEERPLYILETPEGIYYSSLKESLDFINESKKKPYELPHNCVFRIVNGVFTDYEYTVSREEMNVSTYTKSYNYGSYGGYDSFGSCSYTPSKQKEIDFPATSKTSISTSKELNILRESFPPELDLQDMYYHRGRFYRKNNILLNGEYIIDRDGYFRIADEKNVRNPETYYFIRGVLMKNKKAYETFLESSYNDVCFNFAYYISNYSKYAVTCLECEGANVLPDIKSNWYLNEKVFSGTFKTRFGNRVYTIKNGKLSNISKTNVNENVFLDDNVYPKESIVDNTTISRLDEYSNVVSTIREWSQKTITHENVKDIPEVFLMYIDYFNTFFLDKDASDYEIEGETETVLKDLIEIGYTFDFYLTQFECDDFLSEKSIVECFEHYLPEELFEFENRYVLNTTEPPITFNDNIEDIDAETIIDNSLEKEYVTDAFGNNVDNQKGLEFLEEAVNQLSALEDTADELQLIDDDVCQNTAYTIYKNVSQTKKKIIEELEWLKGNEYKSIIQKLNSIRVC